MAGMLFYSKPYFCTKDYKCPDLGICPDLGMPACSIIYNKQIPEIMWISFVTQEYHDHNQWMTHLIAMAKSTCFFLWFFSDPGSIYIQMARKLLAEECRLSWLLIIKCERTIYIKKNFFTRVPKRECALSMPCDVLFFRGNSEVRSFVHC